MDETLFLKEGLQLLDLVHNVLVDGFPATSQLVHALVLVQVLRSGFSVLFTALRHHVSLHRESPDEAGQVGSIGL